MKESLHILASFLETADQIIYESEQENIKNAWKSIIYGKDFAMIPSVTIPVDSLEEMLQIALDRQEEAIVIREYLTDISKSMPKREQVDKLKIKSMFSKIKVAISDIRPVYIAQYADTVKMQCDEIVKTKEIRPMIEKLKEDSYLTMLKAQAVVSLNRNIYYKKSGEMMYDIKHTMAVDANVIDKLLIPFLFQFERVAVPGKVKEPIDTIKGATLGDIVNSLILADKYATRLIATCVKTLFRVADDVGLDKGLLGRYCYQMQAIYNELVKFTAASILQYMQSYLNNMKSCAYIYQQIKQVLPESEVEKLMTESADQYDNPGEIPSRANMHTLLSAIEYMKNKLGLEVTDDSEGEGDLLSYKYIENRYDNITSMTASIVVKLEETPEQTLEDIISYVSAERTVGGMGNAIPVRFLDYYQMCEFRKDYIYADLKMMRHWVPKIIGRIDNAVDNIGQYIENINNDTIHHPNYALNKGVTGYLANLSNRLLEERKNFLEAVEKKLMQVEGLFNGVKMESAIDISDDMEELYATNLRMMEEMYEDVKEDINLKYTRIHARKAAGLFVEDDNGTNNSGNNQPQQNTNNQNNAQHGGQQNNNNNQNNNQQNQNNKSTKPVVTDNSQNNNQNNNQNQNNKSGTGSGKLKDKISGFIQTIIDNITEFMEKKGGKKNLEMIEKQKGYLQTRSFANVSSTILPYITIDYDATLNKILQNAQNIPDAVLQAGNFEQIQKTIFAGTAFANIKGDGSMGEKLVQAFKVGNAPLEVKEFANNELKNFVNEGTKFCEDYYKNFAKDLGEFKNRIENTNFYPGKKNQNDNDKTEESITFIGTCINTAVASAKKAAQEKANDIMVIVNSLKDPNAGNSNQNNNNQNNDQQQNQEQNNNGNNNQQNNQGNNQ